MRCDAWMDRDYQAARLRAERARMLNTIALAERTIDAFVARAEGHDEREVLQWLIATATKRMEKGEKR